MTRRRWKGCPLKLKFTIPAVPFGCSSAKGPESFLTFSARAKGRTVPMCVSCLQAIEDREPKQVAPSESYIDDLRAFKELGKLRDAAPSQD